MSSEAVLVARDLAKSFASLKAVDGISLELSPGKSWDLWDRTARARPRWSI